mgnify:CR=1 FL=1
MMKRWMAMGMALCLTAASLAGCSGTKDAAESTQAEAETSAEEAAAEEETAKESDLDKLTFTYVTSRSMCRRSSRKIRVFLKKHLAIWGLRLIMRS